MNKLAYYDFETTGTDCEKHQGHQLAMILEIDGQEVDRLNIKMRPDPGTPVTPKALETCQLTIEDLKGYEKSQADGYRELIATLAKHIDKFNKADKAFLVGYNERFDNGFLRALFKANNDDYFGSWFWNGSIDVMSLASNSICREGTRATLPNFKLATLAEHYGIQIDGDFHDAMTDVLATREIYRFLNGESGF